MSSLGGEAVKSDAPSAPISWSIQVHAATPLPGEIFQAVLLKADELYKAEMTSRSYTERGYLAPPAEDSRDAPLGYGGKVKRRRATVYDAVAGKLPPRPHHLSKA